MNKSDVMEVLQIILDGLQYSGDSERHRRRIDAMVRCQMYGRIKTKMKADIQPASSLPMLYERQLQQAKIKVWELGVAPEIIEGVAACLKDGLITKDEYEQWTGEKYDI